MQENIKLIDLIIELVDARIPLSSRNPDIDEMGKNKFRMVLLNKSDLADPVWNKKWMDWFESQGIHALEINSKTGAGLPGKAGAGQKERNCQSACKGYGSRDSQRGKIHVH